MKGLNSPWYQILTAEPTSMRAQKLCLIYLSMHTYTSFKMWLTSVTHDAMHVLSFLQFIVPCVYATYVTGFARRGLIRAPFQNTGFTTILWIHHQTIHVCMFCGQQFTSLLFLRLLSEPCQTSMNARFVLSRLCWLFNKGYQAVRSHTTL